MKSLTLIVFALVLGSSSFLEAAMIGPNCRLAHYYYKNQCQGAICEMPTEEEDSITPTEDLEPERPTKDQETHVNPIDEYMLWSFGLCERPTRPERDQPERRHEKRRR